MARALRITVITLLGLIIAVGVWLSFIYLKMLPAPGFFNHIPPLASLTADDQGEDPAIQAMKIENTQLNREVQKLEKELKQAEARQRQAEGKLAKLQKEAEAIEQTTAAEAAQGDIYKELGQYYSSIKAQNAAAVFDELDDETIIGILQNMESEDAAKILAAMTPQRAAIITKKMLQVAG
ncbi:MAG: MotE family protein [Syntrophothermaceae bacterium]|jgi:flagellar motility protein MotE (MotC chaperone)